MNKERRKRLENVKLFLSAAKSELENILEEECAFDSMPENLQCSERGEKSQECIELMETSLELIEESIDNIEDAAC